MTHLDKALDVAVATHQQGKLKEAISLYSTLLSEFPDNAEVHNLLGSALSQAGQGSDAEPHFQQSVALAPTQEGFWVNYGQHLARQGKAKEAVELLSANISSSSTYLPAWQTLFQAALASNQNALAIEYLTKSLGITYHFKTLLSLSQLLVREDKQDEAIRLLESHKQQAVSEHSYWHALCWLYAEVQHWTQLASNAAQWVKYFEGSSDAYRYLASAYFELGRQHEAMAVYETLLRLSEEKVINTDEQLQDKARYVELCVASVELEKAQRVLDTITVKDALPGLLSAQAQLAMFKGDVDTATSLCQQCFNKFPDYLNIYTYWSRIAPTGLTASQYRLLESRIGNQVADSDALAFVLAHYHHGKGEFEAAFNWYQQANALREAKNRHKGADYSRDAEEARFNKVVAASEAIFEQYAELFSTLDHQWTPIFIVGMPRSGTTLLEGMLANHSEIIKTGERIELPNLLRTLVNDDIEAGKLEDTLVQFVRHYTDSGVAKEGAGFFIDKNPSNYLAIGLITTLFPKALIIDIEREPIETVLSIYRHEFSHLWPYATSLEATAHQYTLYQKFIKHWATKTERLIRVRYEALVADPRQQVSSLLERLGLSAESLDIEQGLAEQSFTTFSAMQVREKITNANGIAANYLPMLSAFPHVMALTDDEGLV